MKRKFNNRLKIVLLALLCTAVTNCSEQDPPDVEATTIAAGVQATLTAESAIEATVQAGVQATLTATQAFAPPTEKPVPPTETPIPPTETPASPTETPVPPTETLVPPTQTPVPSTETQPLTISSPPDGAKVPRFNEVSGFGAEEALESGTFLNIIVTTRTGEHWVQTIPVIQNDGTWSSNPVHIGAASLGIGETFRICAVLANQQLPIERTSKFPAGPSTCIHVTRIQLQ